MGVIVLMVMIVWMMMGIRRRMPSG
jgi:hypothetical protein